MEHARFLERRPLGKTGLLSSPLPPDRHAEACRFGDAVHAAARGGRRWMFRQG